MVGGHRWDISWYCPKLMKSKQAKFVQIRCVQLSSPKEWFKEMLAFFVSVVLQPRCHRGVSMLNFFPAAGQSDSTASSTPLTPRTQICWLVWQVHDPLPHVSLQLPGSGSRPCRTCQGQGLQEAVGPPKITDPEPGAGATRPKAELRAVTRSLWHIPSGTGRVWWAPVAVGRKPASVKSLISSGYPGKGSVGSLLENFSATDTENSLVK